MGQGWVDATRTPTAAECDHKLLSDLLYLAPIAEFVAKI